LREFPPIQKNPPNASDGRKMEISSKQDDAAWGAGSQEESFQY
jgi:hypothetical protein